MSTVYDFCTRGRKFTDLGSVLRLGEFFSYVHFSSCRDIFQVSPLFDAISVVFCVESVRDAVGRKVKLSLRKRVKLEIKGDKTENRVLVSLLLLLSSFYFMIVVYNYYYFLSHIPLLLTCTIANTWKPFICVTQVVRDNMSITPNIFCHD